MNMLTKKEIIAELRRVDPFWMYKTHEEKWESIEDVLRYEETRLRPEVAVRLGSYADLM